MMKRTFALALGGLFAAACGGSSPPSAPSASSPVSNAPPGVMAVTMSTAGAAPIFGASVADFARCLHASGDAACFSGARPVVRVATAGASAPGAPSTLTATASGSTVTLTWGVPASGGPVDTYVIEAGSSSGLANLANFATGNTATTFSTGGVPNGTYYVRIKAQNATGTSAASNEAILVVGPAACTSAPGAPSGLASTVSGRTVTLTWNAPGGGCAATSYILQAGPTPGSSALANSSVGNVTSFVANGIGNGSFYIRVVAANAFGQSAASNEIVATVAIPAGAITVTITPNPTPFSGAAFSFCAGNPNTWTYNVTITETNGVAMTVTQQSFSIDGSAFGGASAVSISVPARGSVPLNNLIWCRPGSGPYNVQTAYSGTDANGNSFTYAGPLVTLLAKGGTTGNPRSFPAVWVNASWSGGRTGTPLSSKGIDPVNPFGLLCPANSLVLENHPTNSGSFNDDQLTVTNNCHRQLFDFAVCRTAGSGGGASDIPICSIDPRQTPFSNVYLPVVGSTTNRQPLGQTPINFDVNVFWCSDTSTFNFGRYSNLAQLDCVER